jgi:hypothetical protein
VIDHDFANAKTLEQLLVYERRIESSLYRTIAELKKARRTRQEHDDKVISTNEPNFQGEGWHPQAELGDGLDRSSHPHPEKDVPAARGASTAGQDEDATHISLNEANSEDESSESHLHPDKNQQDEDAAQLVNKNDRNEANI